MASVPPVVTELGGKALRVQWTGLTTTDDVGDPISAEGVGNILNYPIKNVHVEGTPGATFGLVIEGASIPSPAAGNYATLKDLLTAAALTFTAVNIMNVIYESPSAIRPRITGGDGTTNITVTIILAM